MKYTWAIVLLMLTIAFVKADVEIAESAEDVKRFLEENQDNTVALFFIDSSLNEGSEGGFWKGIVTSVSHIFAGEGEGASGQQRVAEIEREISDEAAMMQIDVSNEDLREIQESYDVTTVPFLIVFKRGIVVLKEVPTHETHDKILQVLNVNPVGVHNEDETVTVDESASAAEPTPAAAEPVPEATPEPAPEPVVVESAPAPVAAAPEPTPAPSSGPVEPAKAFAATEKPADEGK